MHRTGSILLLCLGIMVLVATLAFGFLRLVTLTEDTNGASTRQLMAQQAALAGRSHAIEGILRDYGETGAWVRRGDAANSTPKPGYPSAWTRIPGSRLSRLDGRWRLPFLAAAKPNAGRGGIGAYPADDVSGDNRMDIPYTGAWGIQLADSTGWFDAAPFEYGFANAVGRARYFEVEHYRLDSETALSVSSGRPPTTPAHAPAFTDLATVLTDPASGRTGPGYYDARWRSLTEQGMSETDARRKSRYRLRYAVMVEELDSHVPVNATGRDAPHGRSIHETDPDLVAAPSPYDPHSPGALTRRITRYAPSIFNLSFASQPHKNVSWIDYGQLPLYFGDMIEHMFQGRGMAANVDRGANGVPVTWPLMYRRGLGDGREGDAAKDPLPNPSRYNQWGAGNTDKWGVLTQFLYTDGIVGGSDVERKLGGRPTKIFGAPFPNDLSNYVPFTLWHGLIGRTTSFTHQFLSLGAQITGNYHPLRAWSMYFLTPFQRGLELRDPSAARNPAKRWAADVDTPMQINLMTASPITIHAATLAYLPPHAKSIKISKVTYARADAPAKSIALTYGNPRKPMAFNLPSRDLFVQELWRRPDGSGVSAFDFNAPARVVADGTVDPDWHHPGWNSLKGNNRYPGGVMNGDLPTPAGSGADDCGVLVNTDNPRWRATGDNSIKTPTTSDWGMRDQGVDTLAARGFIFLPTNYSVTAPALPPGWGASADMVTSGGAPIQDQITQAEWESSVPTGGSWVDGDGNSHPETGSRPTWSAAIEFQGASNGKGALAGYGRSWWMDVMTAFHTAITVVRAQWTQEQGAAFDPYLSTNVMPHAWAGNQTLAWAATGNQTFRQNAWDPANHTRLRDFDRVFLAQLGIDIDDPDRAVVAPGWNIGVITGSSTSTVLIEPTVYIEKGTWNSGFNPRTLAGNTTSDSAADAGTPRWQRAREAAGLWGDLIPATDPDPNWDFDIAGNPDMTKRAAYISANQQRYGLVFKRLDGPDATARTGDDVVFSSRLRTATMELVLNDWRYSFLGTNPAYAADFRPLDVNGDGLVHCSIYPRNAAALPQETAYHLDRFVGADSNGIGRAIDLATDTPFCIAGSCFMGKSRFYRIVTRGEVWDNVLGRIAASANLDSAICVDSADEDKPQDMTSSQLLYQRWFFDPQRPAHAKTR